MADKMKTGNCRGCLIIILLIVNQLFSYGQDSLMVKGKIVAGKREPVANVSVSVKGLIGRPVITDEQGHFKITVSDRNAWLIIKPLDKYKSKEIFLNHRENLVISLSEIELNSGFDELDVVGGQEFSRDIISPHTSADLSQVDYRNIVSVEKAMQGKVPGLFICNSSGMPGQGAFLAIRGIRSVNTSNQPLVIVDGIPVESPGIFESNITGNTYNPLSSVSPKDISSISILKGPVETSLFGLKAPNGVIMISTLRASSTETIIDISTQTGINIATQRYLPQMNSLQYKIYANEILSTSLIPQEQFSTRYPGLYLQEGDNGYYNYMHNTEWQDYIFSNGLFNDIYFSVKGGSEIATYGLSVGYHDEKGVYTNTNFDRFNVRFVSDFNLFSWFNVKINASLSNINAQLKESLLSAQLSPLGTSLAKSPLLGPYDYSDEGDPLTSFKEVEELGVSNPLAVINGYEGENNNNRFLASIRGNASITDHLQWNTILGLNFNTLKENIFMPNKGIEMYMGGEVRNISQSLNNYLLSVYNDNSLSYKKRFSSLHELKASAGIRINTNQIQVDFGQAMNLPENDEYTSLNDGQAELRTIGGNNAQWNWLSLYQQINYKFKDKYLLHGGLSSDFSTRIGSNAETAFRMLNQPFETYYAIGAGWRISEEFLLKDINGLENLMLRISYGTTGNDDIGNYSALDYYQIARYAETSGLIPGSLPNTTLKPEKNYQFNSGIDLSFWGNRTSVHVDYYEIRTEDMLIYNPQRAYMGFEFRAMNAGSASNKGLDLSVFQRMISRRNFKMDIGAVLSHYTNLVITTAGDTSLIRAFPGGEFITKEGFPLNSFWGYRYAGVFATSEEAAASGLKNDKGLSYRAGDAVFEDLSGPEGEPDSIINQYDKDILGSPNPGFFGSFSIDFYSGRWGLNALFQFAYGQEVFNYVRYTNERMTSLANQSQHVLNRWQYEGDITDVPRARWNDPIGNSQFSSRWIEDGSYIRLKNVTLSYTIPDRFLFFQDARFYISATNLITWSRYLGYDPEFSFSYDQMGQGIDYGLMPHYRQVMIGIKLGL